MIVAGILLMVVCGYLILLQLPLGPKPKCPDCGGEQEYLFENLYCKACFWKEGCSREEAPGEGGS